MLQAEVGELHSFCHAFSAADWMHGTLWTPGDPDERQWEEAQKIWQEFPALHGSDDAPKLGGPKRPSDAAKSKAA